MAAIKNGTREDVAALESTIRHELLHALGFSSSLFAFFRDKDGEPLTEREEDGKPPINRRKQIRQWSERVIKKVLDTIVVPYTSTCVSSGFWPT